jgi:hypothetical protein
MLGDLWPAWHSCAANCLSVLTHPSRIAHLATVGATEYGHHPSDLSLPSGGFIVGRAAAAAENLALRQQVAVFKQSVKRPRLRPRDRVLWVWLSRLWPNWRSALVIVQPETVIKWQRQGFRPYWRWKSRAGKPRSSGPIDCSCIDSRKMSIAEFIAEKSM